MAAWSLLAVLGYSLSLLNVGCAFAADPAPTIPPAQTSGRFSSSNDTLVLADLQDHFSAVAERVAPSVVAISASIDATNSDDFLQTADLNPQRLAAMLDRTTRTVGTGLVIDADGYVLTNEHVIADAQRIWVTTDDRKVYPAAVVGSDPRADLAVLRVPARGLLPVTFARPGTVRRGQWTIALGNPYGLASVGQMAMSVGVVSAVDRTLAKLSSKEDRNYSKLIQTTAEINPGNSGGPLFDLAGNVIGICTAVVLPQKQSNGIGFAIPVSERVLGEVGALKEGREIKYGYLGVVVSTPGSQQRRAAGVPDDIGVAVDSVERGSPAAESLRAGDILTSINDNVVSGSDAFVDVIGACQVGTPTKLIVWREGRQLTIQVALANRQLPSVAINRTNQRFHWRGMLLGPIPADWDFGKSARPEAGLMVLSVREDSPMIKLGITRGSVITGVAGRAVRAISDLQNILHETPVEKCAVQLANFPKGELAASGKD